VANVTLGNTPATTAKRAEGAAHISQLMNCPCRAQRCHAMSPKALLRSPWTMD